MSADEGATFSAEDERWMRRALDMAALAARRSEVPVGAVMIDDNGEIASGYNRPIASHDPSAHAEIVCLRAAAIARGNYRLPGTRLYVTLEPCPMCLGALIHARVSQVIFAAPDVRWGAAGSVLDLQSHAPFNHQVVVRGGLLADEAARQLRAFFRARRS